MIMNKIDNHLRTLVKKLVEELVKEELTTRKSSGADVIGDEVCGAPVMNAEIGEEPARNPRKRAGNKRRK